MPTVNPRIAITVQPHRYDLLKRMAALQGVSMASMVSELLEEFYPVLERVCVALERAQQAQESSKAGIRESASRAYEELLPLTQAATNQLDLLFTDIEAQFRGAKSEPKAAAPESINPRVVTRGSGIKKRKPQNADKPLSGKALRGGR